MKQMFRNLSPDSHLRRDEAALALTEAGYKISGATLASYATRGGGPPYAKFGGVVMYRWSDLLGWAEQRAEARSGGAREAAA